METIKHYGNAAIATIKTEAGFYAALCVVGVAGTAGSMALVAILAAALGR